MKHLIGGHVSIAGGYQHAVTHAVEIGANCFQMFSSSPRIWANAHPSEDAVHLYLDTQNEYGNLPAYFHASYMINLADDGYIGQKSVANLISELELAGKMNVIGTIIHLGSYGYDEAGEKHPHLTEKRFEVLIKNCKRVIEETERGYFIIENAGNKKIGVTLEEIGHIISALNSPRVKVCLDTCHLWAAGYDFSTSEKLNQFLSDFDRLIGLSYLEVFQINDSKGALGSYLDRHENIGQGTMGLEPFRLLLNHPLTRENPFILEVPGFEKKGPDRGNIEILRSLIAF